MRIGTGTLSVLCAAVLAGLAGCGGNSSGTGTTPPPPPPPPPPPATFQFSGKVMSGKLPIVGAAVKVYAAGSGGYGTGATSLANAVTTDSTGAFSISGDTACPSSSSLAYVTATGGHTGSGADNAAIGLIAPLGSCGGLGSSTAVTVNELTTVASVWVLAPFLKTGGVIGTSSGNGQGLANAFANIGNLVDSSAGVTPGKTLPAGATLPTAKLNTLADILSACVEQSSATACSTLFAGATPSSGSAPSNTLDAALDMALNPGMATAPLFALASGSAAFQPIVAAAPPDWTLAVTYTGGGLNTPGSLGVDASGNVWVADYFQAVSEFSGSGQALSPATGITGGGLDESYGLAVNVDGNVWVTNEQSSGVNSNNGAVTVLNSAGLPVSGANGYIDGGIFFPIAAAADSDGSVWIADYGDSTSTKYAQGGTAISPSTGFGSGQLQGPVAVAVDANHNAWFVNQAGQTGSVTSISSDGSKVNTFACGGDAPSGIATDAVAASGATGHVWTSNYYSDSISELAIQSDGSAVLVGTAYTNGGIKHPNGLAVDGAGNVWVANYRGDSISELAGANAKQPGAGLSPSTGFGLDAALVAPFAVAIDASGNVWVSNQGSTSTTQGGKTVDIYTITQFLGAATPVKTPVIGPPQLP